MTLWRLRATVDDRPGFLAVLAASLALRSINILSVQVHATESGAVDDFLVDAPDELSEDDLRAAVLKGRGRDAWVRPADAHGLVDTPTRLLDLAARLVSGGEELGVALAGLLGDVLVTWRAESCPERAGFSEHAMLLPDPSGGTLTARRLDPPFTPAEYARANALVDLAASMARAEHTRCRLLLPDGTELTLRPGETGDVEALRRLHARCSARSRYRRYLGGTDTPSEATMRRLLVPADGYALVAEVGDEIVALANLAWDGADAELAVLVADGWQRRGLGTALVRRALTLAAFARREAVYVRTHADNAPMLHTMHRLGLPLRVDTDGLIVTVSVEVTGLRRAGVTAGSGSPSPVR
jgi:GNAT superfamily N-acetyltransferase